MDIAKKATAGGAYIHLTTDGLIILGLDDFSKSKFGVNDADVLARHGLSNDRTDLASVLRVPGSINYKTDPIDVVVERFEA